MTNLEWLIKGSYIEFYDDNRDCKLIINGKGGKLKALQSTNQFDVLKWLLEEHEEQIKLKQWEYDLLKELKKDWNYAERKVFWELNKKGYFKCVTNISMSPEEILNNCEVVDD